MPKISSYTTTAPALTDKLIGTDTNDSSATKNFTISDILLLNPSSNAFTLSLDAATYDVQNGLGYNTLLDVSFGAAQTNTDVSLSASNEIIFNTAGDYLVELNLSGGILTPSGATETGAIYYGVFVGGVQINYTQVNRVIYTAGTSVSDLDTLNNTFLYQASASDVMQIKAECPTNFGLSSFGSGITLNSGPSAQIRISKAN